MERLLSLKGISAGYGGKTVVRDVSFEISRGEFCALLGLNGSGKTTLLKAICCLLPVTRGQCLAGGLDIARLHEHERAKYISYIPQRLSALRGVRVLDVVMMGLNAGLKMLGSPSAGDRALALEVLEKTGVGELAEEIFSGLSEGQKQLVILARTLVQNTPVMLMDEPDSALDFLNRHKSMDRFRRLIREERKAALVTLHDPNIALNYCDRIIMLHDGKVVSDIVLQGASLEDIKSCLSRVYGDITLLERDGSYMVTK